MSASAPSNQSDDKLKQIRKRNSINTANFRARHSANQTFIKKRINEILAQLGRPVIEFTKKKSPHVLKGKARPIHLPPEEERRHMTDAQLSEWKAVQRRKRKAEQAKERRAREDEMDKNLKKLWMTLEKEIADGDGREPLYEAGIYKTAPPVRTDGGSTLDWENVNTVIKSRQDEHSMLPPVDTDGGNVADAKPAAAAGATKKEGDGALLFLARVASKNQDDSPDQKEMPHSEQTSKLQASLHEQNFAHSDQKQVPPPLENHNHAHSEQNPVPTEYVAVSEQSSQLPPPLPQQNNSYPNQNQARYVQQSIPGHMRAYHEQTPQLPLIPPGHGHNQVTYEQPVFEKMKVDVEQIDQHQISKSPYGQSKASFRTKPPSAQSYSFDVMF